MAYEEKPETPEDGDEGYSEDQFIPVVHRI